jgi:hypothetical protein
MFKRFIFLYILLLSIFYGCKEHKKILIDSSNLQSNCVKNLTEVIVQDIFSPPVSSRIYAYCNLAYYEAIKYNDTSSNSLTKQLNGFSIAQLNISPKTDFDAAAVIAFFTTAKALVFSKDSINEKLKIYTAIFKNNLDNETFNNSILFAQFISDNILKRASDDNYKLTRGMPRYSVYNNNEQWQQTPPDYFDAIEPNWKLIKPLLLDSAGQYKPIASPTYSTNKTSEFYKEMLAVYTKNKNLTATEDTIAHFWDDNPFVTNHKGHFTFATKKTTPVGHWMGIIGILSNKKNAIETAKLYASTSVVIFDAFISCWKEKYESKKIRPITAIRSIIDDKWEPLLQTPPFPEYTSGHSVISSAAAIVIENIIGNKIAFTDTTEKQYLGLVRNFSSITDAANEAGISRFYGGIHFLTAITEGKKQGAFIGNYFNTKIKY